MVRPRARGRSRLRAGLTLWLGWLLVTGLTFSLMAGIFHPYYTVALAPAIGALVGIGAVVLWRHRESLVASGLLGLTVAFTTGLAFELLARDASWHPWLRYAVAVLGFASALMIVGVRHLPRRVGLVVAATAVVAALAGPAAYSLATAATPHTGSIPSAGPSSSGLGRPCGGFEPPGGGAAAEAYAAGGNGDRHPSTGGTTGGATGGAEHRRPPRRQHLQQPR